MRECKQKTLRSAHIVKGLKGIERIFLPLKSFENLCYIHSENVSMLYARGARTRSLALLLQAKHERSSEVSRRIRYKDAVSRCGVLKLQALHESQYLVDWLQDSGNAKLHGVSRKQYFLSQT
jgi:hypothetical protein